MDLPLELLLANQQDQLRASVAVRRSYEVRKAAIFQSQHRGLNHSQRREHVEGGFGLIEVMVTVAIMGILASIALPNLGHQVDKTSDRMTKAHLSTRAGLCSEAIVFEETLTLTDTDDITYSGECAASKTITATTNKTSNAFTATFNADGEITYNF